MIRPQKGDETCQTGLIFQSDERALLNWLLDEESLEIPGKIEKVNPTMLDNIIAQEPNVVVYFYAEDYDKKAADILKVRPKVEGPGDQGLCHKTYYGRNLRFP
jgi:hypothetical protein